MKRVVVVLALLLTASLGSGAAAQSTVMAPDGDTIGYMIYGSGSTTVVLVHGWTNSRAFWEPHIPTLSGRYSVVTVDLASFGESSAHRSDWTMQSFARDLDAVLDALDAAEVVVVGFSMGGAVAIELAALARDEVIGVVLVDVLQDVEMRPSDEFIEDFARDIRDGWGDPIWVRGFAFTEGSSETLVRRLLSQTRETVPDVWWASLRNFFLWVRSDFRRTLADIHVPISAINTDQVPTDVEAWRNYVPSFSVHTLSGVGHLGALWERVDEFDEALIGFVEAYRRSARN